MFPLRIYVGKEMQGGNTLSNSIDCSQLNWDRGLRILCGCGLFGQNEILFFAGLSFTFRDLLLLVYSSYLQFTFVNHRSNHIHHVSLAHQHRKKM